jgi:hypothetical protein
MRNEELHNLCSSQNIYYQDGKMRKMIYFGRANTHEEGEKYVKKSLPRIREANRTVETHYINRLVK